MDEKRRNEIQLIYDRSVGKTPAVNFDVSVFGGPVAEQAFSDIVALSHATREMLAALAEADRKLETLQREAAEHACAAPVQYLLRLNEVENALADAMAEIGRKEGERHRAELQIGEVKRLFSLWSEDKLDDVAFAGLMSGVLSGNDVPNKRYCTVKGWFHGDFTTCDKDLPCPEHKS